MKRIILKKYMMTLAIIIFYFNIGIQAMENENQNKEEQMKEECKEWNLWKDQLFLFKEKNTLLEQKNEEIQLINKNLIEYVMKENEKNDTALHFVAYNGYEDMVNLLLNTFSAEEKKKTNSLNMLYERK
jgi:hypothetical protein